MVQDLLHNPGLGESDHECLRFELTCSKDFRSNVTIPNYHKAEYVTIRSRLQDVNWTQLLNERFLKSYAKFITKLETSMEGCVPKKTLEKKQKSIYLSQDTIKLKDKKAKLWRQYKKTRGNYDLMQYKRAKNKLRSLTRSQRINFENNLAKDIKTQPKKFWAYVKSRTKTRCKIPSLRTKESKASTAAEKAEALRGHMGLWTPFGRSQNTDSFRSLSVLTTMDIK